jgi:hypothetical protein
VKRLFYVAFGATAGVLVVRRLGEVAQKWTPEGMASQAGGAGQRVGSWWETVKDAAAARELELREALGLDEQRIDDRGFDESDSSAA